MKLELEKREVEYSKKLMGLQKEKQRIEVDIKNLDNEIATKSLQSENRDALYNHIDDASKRKI